MVSDLFFGLQAARTLEELTQALFGLQRALEADRIRVVQTGQVFPGEIGVHVLYQEPVRTQRVALWKVRLAAQLAGYNGSRILSQARSADLQIAGKARSVMLVRLLYVMLTVKLEQLTQTFAGTGQQAKYRYRNDAVDRLVQQLELAVTEARTGAAAAVVDKLDLEFLLVKKWSKQHLNPQWVR